MKDRFLRFIGFTPDGLRKFSNTTNSNSCLVYDPYKKCYVERYEIVRKAEIKLIRKD